MDKKCKRLGNRATKRERADAHRVKMEVKQNVRDHNYQNVRKSHVFANLSQNHPEYGETPAEQSQRMLEKSS